MVEQTLRCELAPSGGPAPALGAVHDSCETTLPVDPCHAFIVEPRRRPRTRPWTCIRRTSLLARHPV